MEMSCYCIFYNLVLHDEVAEWLRRWTANPLGSARVGSNPILVGIRGFYGVMVSTLDFESSDPSSNLGRTCTGFTSTGHTSGLPTNRQQYTDPDVN